MRSSALRIGFLASSRKCSICSACLHCALNRPNRSICVLQLFYRSNQLNMHAILWKWKWISHFIAEWIDWYWSLTHENLHMAYRLWPTAVAYHCDYIQNRMPSTHRRSPIVKLYSMRDRRSAIQACHPLDRRSNGNSSFLKRRISTKC